jgi:hypothetical protein
LAIDTVAVAPGGTTAGSYVMAVEPDRNGRNVPVATRSGVAEPTGEGLVEPWKSVQGEAEVTTEARVVGPISTAFAQPASRTTGTVRASERSNIL